MCTYNADQNVPRSFFFCGFFPLSLLPGTCLLRARAQRNTRRSRGCLLGKGGRRPANGTASATWSSSSSSSPPTATVEKEGGPLRRKQKGCIPSRPARKKGEKHIHESLVRGGGRPMWRQEYHEMQGKGNRLLSSEQAESPPVRVRHLG